MNDSCQIRRHYRVFLLLQLTVGIMVVHGLVPQADGQGLFNNSYRNSDLPDAPSALLHPPEPADGQQQQQKMQSGPALPPPCPISLRPSWIKLKSKAPATANTTSTPPTPGASPVPCTLEHPLRIVVDYEVRQPLTPGEKAYLAVHDVIQPFNLLVIAAEAGVGVGANSHSAYGPGMKGFGRLFGYQLLQDAQGEFFGTYAIPSLVHQDPRYRRMQHASVKRRIVHALAHTLIAQRDDGSSMPNYSALLTYPISAELSNLYVPGIHGNGPDTAKRIAIGLATDPASNIIAEFLPDIARRIHVRSLVIQQIVNNMALQGVGTSP